MLMCIRARAHTHKAHIARGKTARKKQIQFRIYLLRGVVNAEWERNHSKNIYDENGKCIAVFDFQCSHAGAVQCSHALCGYKFIAFAEGNENALTVSEKTNFTHFIHTFAVYLNTQQLSKRLRRVFVFLYHFYLDIACINKIYISIKAADGYRASIPIVRAHCSPGVCAGIWNSDTQLQTERRSTENK